MSKDLKEGNKRTRWTEREPYAYWKGNPAVAATRMDLLKCNVSDKQDWNARVYAQVTTKILVLGFEELEHFLGRSTSLEDEFEISQLFFVLAKSCNRIS